jgi:hypothetical protein
VLFLPSDWTGGADLCVAVGGFHLWCSFWLSDLSSWRNHELFHLWCSHHSIFPLCMWDILSDVMMYSCDEISDSFFSGLEFFGVVQVSTSDMYPCCYHFPIIASCSVCQFDHMASSSAWDFRCPFPIPCCVW